MAKISFGPDEEDYNPRKMYERGIFRTVLINGEREGRFQKGSIPCRLAEKYESKEMPDGAAAVLSRRGRRGDHYEARRLPFPPIKRSYYAGQNFPPTELEKFNDSVWSKKVELTVDYGRSFKEMFDAGVYIWGHGGSRYGNTPGWDEATATYLEERFPISGVGTKHFEAQVFYCDCCVRAAIRMVKGKGFELARIEHLLALGEKYPWLYERPDRTIVGLGSVSHFREEFEREVCAHSPCLNSNLDGRNLSTRSWGGASYCLGVRKIT